MNSANQPFEQFDPNFSSHSSSAEATVLSCDEVSALIPAYSIGAADPEEAAVVQTRLSACPTAAAELAEYGKIAEALLYTAPPQQAPTHLVNQLRAAIGAPQTSLPNHHPLAKQLAALPPRPAVATAAKASPFTLVVPPQPVRRWTFMRTVATAASLLLVSLNVGLLVQNQKLRTAQEKVAAELAQQKRALIFLAAEDPQEVVLPAAQTNSLAQADVSWNDSLGIAVVYVRAFPTLPPDKAYQIWLNKDGQRTSPGLFTVDNDGAGIFVFSIDHSLDIYDAIGITPEPASGSAGPTAPPVVRGPV